MIESGRTNFKVVQMNTPADRRARYGAILGSPESSPKALLVAMLKYYGPGCLQWEAETLWQELRADFDVDPSSELRNKYHAARTVAVSSLPWKHYHVFLPTAVACFGGSAVFPELIQPEPHQAAWCVQFMSTTHPKQAFDDEIRKTLAALLYDLGYAYFPPEILQVNGYLLELGTPAELQDKVRLLLDGTTSPVPGTSAAFQADQVIGLRAFLSAEEKRFRDQIERLPS